MIKKLYDYVLNREEGVLTQEELLEHGFKQEEISELKSQKVITGKDSLTLNRHPFHVYSRVKNNDDKRSIIIDYIYNNHVFDFTKGQLLEMGYNDEDIKKLCGNNIIRLKNDKYVFVASKFLTEYSIVLTSINEQEKLDFLFNKYNLKLGSYFLTFVHFYDYIDAIKIFREMNKTTDDMFISNNNFFMYLLANITDDLYEFTGYCKDFNKHSIMTDYSNDSSALYSNKVRDLVFHNKFEEAGKIAKKFGKLYVVDMIYKAANTNKNNLSNLYNWACEHEYDKIITYLNNRAKKISLSKYENAVAHTANEIRKMLLSSKIPEVTNYDSNDYFSLVFGNDFKTADEMRNSDNVLSILVEQAAEEIERLEISNQKKEKEQRKTKDLNVLLNLIKYGDIEVAKKIEDLYSYIPISKYRKFINELNDFKNVDKELFEYLCRVYNENNLEEINWCLDEIWNTVPEMSDESFYILEDHTKYNEFDPDELLKVFSKILVKTKDVILLPPMEEEKVLKIKEKVHSHNLDKKLIERDGKNILVLFYSELHNNNLKGLYDASIATYCHEEYRECINISRLIIDYNKDHYLPYANIAKCNYFLGNMDEAVKFQTITDSLCDKYRDDEIMQKIRNGEKNRKLVNKKED